MERGITRINGNVLNEEKIGVGGDEVSEFVLAHCGEMQRVAWK